MRLLLDSHAFLWWNSQSAKLGPAARSACADSTNDLLLSVASIWEMVIKEALGKLHVGPGVEGLVTAEVRRGGVQLLGITLGHLWTLKLLPQHHRDPFDRLVIAQAKSDDLVLVTADPAASQYGVRILW